MIFRRKIKFHVAQLGDLDRPVVQNALGLAGLVQDAFEFELLPDRINIPGRRYQLQNGTFDLDAAVSKLSAIAKLPRPLILFTSKPYGDLATQHEADYAYFSDLAFSKGVGIVSTYLWDPTRNAGGLQPYVFMQLAHAILSYVGGLKPHPENRHCLFDYCEETENVYRIAEGPGLCEPCSRLLMKQINSGSITTFQVASVTRLFDRAKGTRRCFYVTPLAPSFRNVHVAVGRAVTDAGWHISRGDQITQPRRITDAVIQALLASELVVVDATGSNANVFYELGFAHAAGNDVVMLCQKSRTLLPFDVNHERTIFYRPTVAGLRTLEAELRQMVALAE